MSNTRTARIAGAWYLGLGLTGMAGFLVVRPQIVDASDPSTTLANLVDHPHLAHLLVALEMGIVLTQAFAAVYFFRLFRSVDPTAAYAVATFGMVNAVAIMVSGAFMATANSVASDAGLAPAGDAVGTVGLLFELSTNAWGMGNLFFGLWLIPMGWVAIAHGRFPRMLGWALVAGGIGYIVSGLVGYGLTDAPTWLVDGLAFPATIGEFWMIGYLLVKGIRPDTALAAREATAPA